MKRKIADLLPSLEYAAKAPVPTEPRDQFHAMLKTRADKQFTLDNMFSVNATTREKERAKARKLFVQAPVATTSSPTLAPSLHEDRSHEVSIEKSSMAVLTDAEMKILGMEKTAILGADDIIGAAVGHHYGKKQRNRKEEYDFAGKQLAAALLLPGGLGYQAGRYVAHHQKKKHSSAASPAPTVDAWLEKNASLFRTQAQMKYPELLKAAADPAISPVLKRVTTTAAGKGPVARTASLAGGAA